MSTSGDSQQITSDLYMREVDTTDDESDDKNGNNYMLREQDRFLPICNIIKIMKMPVPENGKIAKDARECIQECVSEFISFITSEAIERSIAENRKTVNGDDLLYAFANLGFDNYVEPLSIYLHKFRESTKSDRNLSNLYNDDSSSDIPTIGAHHHQHNHHNNNNNDNYPPTGVSVNQEAYKNASTNTEVQPSITITPLGDEQNLSLRRSMRLKSRQTIAGNDGLLMDSDDNNIAPLYLNNAFLPQQQQELFNQDQQPQQINYQINSTSNNTLNPYIYE